MAYTTIDDPTLYFNTVLYTGNGSADHAITGFNHSTDWVWIKRRNSAVDHRLYDIVRGANKGLETNNTDAEITTTTNVKSFDSDGFTTDGGSTTNVSGGTFVAWSWEAGGTASSNTDGSITSSVSANTTAGFSIVSYTGTGANATVGHGLGQALDMVIVKNRDDVANWKVWHNYLSGTQVLELNNTDAVETPAVWNSTIPTSSVFSVGTQNTVNGSGDNIIAYCFAEKKGYSKFGSYTGNGSSDGSYIHLGFKPSYFLLKSSSNAESWHIYDNQRANAYNPHETYAPTANASSAEATASTYGIDFVSNGVKLRGSGSGINGSGYSFIYMAFAENPFVTSTGICCTAR